MNNLNVCESDDKEVLNENLVSVCGLFCGACGIYLATLEKDIEKLLQYAVVLNQSFDDTFCDGCRSGRKSVHCSRMCSFIECALNMGIEFCGACPKFPCDKLTEFQSKMPHRIEVQESQNRLKEIGWEQWLIEIKEKYSCPQCGAINTAYDISCRKCGNTPGCKFVDLHKSIIDKHLSKE